jgi:hypothetical protein
MSNFNDEVCEYNYTASFTENFIDNTTLEKECKTFCAITSEPKICYNNCMSPDCLSKCDNLPKGSDESRNCYEKCV